MTTPPIAGVERRIGQRFTFNLPVGVRDVASSSQGVGFTHDLSSRGAFLFTDLPLREGAEVELTLKMPSEITLGENMPVRCRGRVLRVEQSAEALSRGASENKIGVAVCIQGYEYLAESGDTPADFRRISALHGACDAEPASTTAPAAPRLVAG
ncbi:MAG TPA: PilZ domain-containing protein [Candidatus Binatia bacterium]|nr:PilZ domain-containing protein [Candidatus Binatia bacterium]